MVAIPGRASAPPGLTMQLFAELPDGRVVVLEASPAETVNEAVRRLAVAEPSVCSADRVVKGGVTLERGSTLNQCGIGAGDMLWLQGRLRGGSTEPEKKEKTQEDSSGGPNDTDEEDVSFLRDLWNQVTGKTQGSNGPLIPMTLYIVFLQSGFLLSQISTTFMVISQWGVEYVSTAATHARCHVVHLD